jgi:tetratricopeptide (TPR) repeat protein
VLTHLDRYEAALASFTQALKIQPNNQTALIFQGMAYHHLGRYKQAYASYYQAIGKKRRSFWEKLLEFGR